MAFAVQKHVENLSVFKMLRQSSYTFYLTGSRYFGNYTENSDWDFFADYNTIVREF